MNAKKDKRKNLERYKSLFFQSGLIVSLAVVLFAFEWKSFDSGNHVFVSTDFVLIEDELPPVVQEKKQEKKLERADVKAVEDDQKDVKDVDINVEDDQKKEAKKYIPVKKDPIDDPDIGDDKIVYRVVEDMPLFPGGDDAMFSYLAHNIQYPMAAKETGIQGTVHLTFVIETDGSISNVGLLRGIGGGCDEEAMRVVRNMPRWTPGNQQGRPVRVQFTLPVKFVLH
ncbi:MAG: energy transducer TonB [Bacteroidales bacterium]|nr:energy transducer TonB [Bacteroidales bacterium]